MPKKLTTPLSLHISATPLSPSSFAPFGDVIANPHPDIRPSASLPSNLSHNAVSANQHTAIKYQNLQQPPSPSGNPPISTLLPYTYAGPSRAGLFRVDILERHPFTTQTFVPLAASAGVPHAAYLVIVAPTLPAEGEDSSLPAPKTGGKGPGRPDLANLKAFVATPGQAVTYGAGTWHAPMVALGPPGTAIDFVVIASGVGAEDCQEVVIEAQGEGVVVQVPERMPVAKL
uniref:Ureidoglycolate hydrolase n=1 Tax=Colletotrichum fructicola (strain Nara gc5) TaxID=1213859 RepID=L2GK89_COLFN